MVMTEFTPHLTTLKSNRSPPAD